MIEKLDFALLGNVHLLWCAAAVLLLVAWGTARRRRTLAVFGVDEGRHAAWLRALRRRRWLRAGLLAASIVLLTAAAVQPRCNPVAEKIASRGRDIAVILDVSRSMLADDLKPSRLERAKLELLRLADSLRGDRIGLVAFAGNATVLSPLTSNYSFFKSVVRNASSRSASQGGTHIGDAIRKALRDLFGLRDTGTTDSAPGAKAGETVVAAETAEREVPFADILLITDGEDHNSYPLQAAAKAADFGVGLYIVGLGSEEGAAIPIETEGGGRELLRYKGEVHRSKFDATTLRDMIFVKSTARDETIRGAFLPAGTDNPDIVGFYRGTIAKEVGRERLEEHVNWTEIFQPFLLAGLCLYLVCLALPERPRHERSAALLDGGAA